MLNENNTERRLPYGLSHVTEPAWLLAAEFLYSQYPGIFKMRMKRWNIHDKKGVYIKIISGGPVRRRKYCWGYSLGTAVSNLISRIKADPDLTERFKSPESFVS